MAIFDLIKSLSIHIDPNFKKTLGVGATQSKVKSKNNSGIIAGRDVVTHITNNYRDRPKDEKQIAKEVVTFLENKRVLYNPYELEMPDHCVRAVIEVRNFITEKISELEGNSILVAPLRSILFACIKFMNENGHKDFHRHYGGSDSWKFDSALGEMRGVIGVYLTYITQVYELDVHGDLANILETNTDGVSIKPGT